MYARAVNEMEIQYFGNNADSAFIMNAANNIFMQIQQEDNLRLYLFIIETIVNIRGMRNRE